MYDSTQNQLLLNTGKPIDETNDLTNENLIRLDRLAQYLEKLNNIFATTGARDLLPGTGVSYAGKGWQKDHLILHFSNNEVWVIKGNIN